MRYFVAVAEELHFGRAAERMHIAQPPLSQQIRDLEEELGARLFARTSRSVRLTRAGEAYLVHARAVLARVAEAAAEARSVHEGLGGHLRVGYMNPVMDAVLCRALAAFRAARPRVELRLSELPSTEQLAWLRAERLDLAFVRLVGAEQGGAGQGAMDMAGLCWRLVTREPYVLAVPQGHPLSGGARATLRQVGGCPLLMFPRAGMPALHDALLGALRAAGARPRIAQEVAGKHASLSLVAAGMGVCLVPASARDWRRAGVELVELEPGLPVVEMAAAWQSIREDAALLELVDLAAACGAATDPDAAG